MEPQTLEIVRTAWKKSDGSDSRPPYRFGRSIPKTPVALRSAIVSVLIRRSASAFSARSASVGSRAVIACKTSVLIVSLSPWCCAEDVTGHPTRPVRVHARTSGVPLSRTNSRGARRRGIIRRVVPTSRR